MFTLWTRMVSLYQLDSFPFKRLVNSMPLNPQSPLPTLICSLDLASMIRYTVGNYTGTHQDVIDITSWLTLTHCGESLAAEISRILTVESPAYFNAKLSQENFKLFLEHGNHITIASNVAKVMETISKEVQHCYVVPFPKWLARMCPNIL